jgi:flagellar basal body P-ring protein FlgI
MITKDYRVSVHICEEDSEVIRQANKEFGSLLDKIKDVALSKDQTLILLDENSGWVIIADGHEVDVTHISYGGLQELQLLYLFKSNPNA